MGFIAVKEMNGGSLIGQQLEHLRMHLSLPCYPGE
jgi:hypothetical protein